MKMSNLGKYLLKCEGLVEDGIANNCKNKIYSLEPVPFVCEKCLEYKGRYDKYAEHDLWNSARELYEHLAKFV